MKEKKQEAKKQKSTRPSLVVYPGKNVGIVLHRDGRVRFQMLGSDPQPAPKFEVDEAYDFVADKSWNRAIAGLDGIHEAFDAKDKLDDAIAVLEDIVESASLRHCPSDHKAGVTKGDVEVCLEKDCLNARIDSFTVPDYESARKPKRSPKPKQSTGQQRLT